MIFVFLFNLMIDILMLKLCLYEKNEIVLVKIVVMFLKILFRMCGFVIDL